MKITLALYEVNLFLHLGWFLKNLGKDLIPTNMHTTVSTFFHCSSIGNESPWQWQSLYCVNHESVARNIVFSWQDPSIFGDSYCCNLSLGAMVSIRYHSQCGYNLISKFYHYMDQSLKLQKKLFISSLAIGLSAFRKMLNHSMQYFTVKTTAAIQAILKFQGC